MVISRGREIGLGTAVRHRIVYLQLLPCLCQHKQKVSNLYRQYQKRNLRSKTRHPYIVNQPRLSDLRSGINTADGFQKKNNLFLQLSSSVLSGKASHRSSTDTADYRETPASLKWKAHTSTAAYLPVSCHFSSFLNLIQNSTEETKHKYRSSESLFSCSVTSGK